MSLPAKTYPASEQLKSHLLIQDQTYQFLPNLAAIYGDTCALMLQQLWWVIHVRPYFEGEELPTRHFEGRLWIRIHNFMWFDTLEGICRHLSKSNFYKLRGQMKESGVLLVRPNFDDDNAMLVNTNTKSEGPLWYAVNTEKVNQDESRYNEARNEAIARRKAERAYIKSQNRDAHWRPRTGEDVSKSLDFCRVIFSEHLPDELPQQGGGQVLSTFRTEQNSTVDETQSGLSTFFGTSPVHNLDFIESTFGTSSRPLLGQDTLYIKKTTSEEVKTATARSLESNEVATPNGVVAAQSSIDNLPSSKRKAPAQTQKSSAPKLAAAQQQTALPIVAPTAKPRKLPADLAKMSVELTARLCEVAAGEMIEISEVDAAAIVGTWPVSQMSHPVLVERMNRIGLTKKLAVELIKKDEVMCRWQLVCWERRPQREHGYFKHEGGKAGGTRVGAFRRTVEEGWEPYRAEAWIEEMLSEIKERQHREQFEVDSARAAELWQHWSAPRRRRFYDELQTVIARRWPAGNGPAPHTPAYDELRVKTLLDPDVRATVEAWQESSVARDVAPGAPIAFAPDVAPDAEPLTKAELTRCDLYISRLRFAVEGGDVLLDDLGGQIKDLPASDAMKQHIEGEVRRLTALKRAA